MSRLESVRRDAERGGRDDRAPQTYGIFFQTDYLAGGTDSIRKVKIFVMRAG